MLSMSVRVVVVLSTLAAVLAGFLPAANAEPTSVRWKEGRSATAAPELIRFNELLAGLAEQLKPGLVHVRVRRSAPKEKEKEQGEEPTEPRRSTGSGFIVDEAGIIVTNAHVVEDVDSVEVRLADGRRFKGKVIGRDRRVDLALLKIDGATGLTALALGDSNKLRVGEFVLALGHPFGLEHSVSFGIVSRKGTPLTVAAPGFDYIQTDAAINPGNSGGPLVNMAGEIVGVNSMAARNGSIGFAIPSNLVKVLVPQLAAKGRIEWGWLGVTIGEVSEEDAERLGIKEPKGVMIRSVLPGEPAEKGGVKPNDVVVAVNGADLQHPRDLQRMVSSTPVGTRVRIRVLREGREQDLDVTIGSYKDTRAK